MYEVLISFSADPAKDGRGGVFYQGQEYPDPTTSFEPDKDRIMYLLNKQKQKNNFNKPLIKQMGGNQKQQEVEPEPTYQPEPEVAFHDGSPQPDYPPDEYQEHRQIPQRRRGQQSGMER